MEPTTTSSNSTPLKQESVTSMKDHPLAAFSLASLASETGPRSGSLSLMNLNVNFDTGVFLKSGSFDCLNNLLGSQIFKQDPNSMNHIPLPTLNGEQKSQMLHSQPQLQSPTSHPQSLPPPFSSSAPVTIPASQNLNAVGTPHQNVVVSSVPINVNVQTIKTNVPQTVTSNTEIEHSNHQIMPYVPNNNNAIVQHHNNDINGAIIERRGGDDNSKFVDVTPFLTLPQHEAAKKLGIPSSTLAKRWKEASCNRKWPYRTVSKLDKEILTLLKNVENAKAELSPSVEATLGLLLKKRQEELKTVLVRL